MKPSILEPAIGTAMPPHLSHAQEYAETILRNCTLDEVTDSLEYARRYLIDYFGDQRTRAQEAVESFDTVMKRLGA